MAQAHLEGTGTDPRARRNLDHGVLARSRSRLLQQGIWPSYRHRIKGNRQLPVFTVHFSRPHLHRVSAAEYLLACEIRIQIDLLLRDDNKNKTCVLDGGWGWVGRGENDHKHSHCFSWAIPAAWASGVGKEATRNPRRKGWGGVIWKNCECGGGGGFEQGGGVGRRGAGRVSSPGGGGD